MKIQKIRRMKMNDGQPGVTPNQTNTHSERTFSAEYVSELRQENASWRNKLRDMEAKYQSLESKLNKTTTEATIASELTRRGIKANPSWVTMGDKETPEQAVNNFLKEYPAFNTQSTDDGMTDDEITANIPAPHQQRKWNVNGYNQQDRSQNIPGVFPPRQNTNVPHNANNRDVMELAKDPIARAKVRDLYRQKLSGK